VATYEIDSVTRAVRVLQALADGNGGRGVSELGRGLGLGKASVFRTLRTLSELGLVQQDAATRQYRLGPELIPLGQAAAEATDLRAAARPVMERLSRETGMPCYLNVAGNQDVVCLEHVRSLAQIDLYGQAGHTMPYHACPSGLVLLAFGPPERLARALSLGLKRYARNTIVGRRALRETLAEVRRRGHAFGVDDLEDGVTSTSAPICDVHGAVVAALGLAGFSHMFKGRREAMIAAVETAAAEISTARRRPEAVSSSVAVERASYAGGPATG
jgi:IclR family transcriptional regulator, KDG regulon repressor